MLSSYSASAQTESKILNSCAKSEFEYVKDFILPKIETLDSAFDGTISPSTQLIVIGEWHYDLSIHAAYPDMIRSIKKKSPQLDCLFLEHPSNFVGYIHNFEEGKLTWDEYAHQAYLFEKRAYGGQNPYVQWNGVEPFYANKKALAMAARDLSIKIYAIDVDTSKTLGSSVESRNQFMYNKIKALFLNGRCHMGFFPVGSAHQSGILSLASSGFSTVSVGLMGNTGTNIPAIERGPLQVWDGSNEITSTIPALPFAIRSNQIFNENYSDTACHQTGRPESAGAYDVWYYYEEIDQLLVH